MGANDGHISTDCKTISAASLDNHTRDQIAKLMAKEAALKAQAQAEQLVKQRLEQKQLRREEARCERARKCEEAQKWQAARLERKPNKKPFYKELFRRRLFRSTNACWRI